MGCFDNMDMAYIDSLNQSYKDAEIKTNFVIVPEGTYQAYIDKIGLKESKYVPGTYVFFIEFVILEGPYKGVHVTKTNPITEERVAYIKQDMQTLGFRMDNDIRNLEDEERLREMLDMIVEIHIRQKSTNKNGQKKTYNNIFLNKVLGMYNNPAEGGEYPAPTDDDLPPWMK